MKIGIKYCGGCSAFYDRLHMVDQLLQIIRSLSPEITYDTSEYCPLWLVVCGCTRSCPETGMLQAGRILTLSSARDFTSLPQIIWGMDEAEKEQDLRILSVGEEASLTRVFTCKDLRAFAALSGDWNGIHTDPNVAEKGPFLHPVIHGTLTATLFSAILGTRLPGSGTVLLKQTEEFLFPVFTDDTITATIRLVSFEEHKSNYIGKFEGVCHNQDGREVLRGSFLELMSKKFFILRVGDNHHDK